jgi:cellulose synthase/poly-beta-1,6-N-acetylglucosamine synthase-like glycosyltransferase
MLSPAEVSHLPLEIFSWQAWLVGLLAMCVLIGALPVLAGLMQFLLIALSYFHQHVLNTKPYWPRISVIVPAWNEGAVIGLSIDRLMQLNYPKDKLRVYLIDDGSTDETPRIAIEKSKQYRGRVFHIRRVAGGEGKAHTLNYGLNVLWKNEWSEAVLIMDADVIYTPDSLQRMARHLSDPEIGAVTAYIKEGSASPNYVQRFITFEYVTATGGSRRAQNVLGFLACLSGGAQLHSRQNLLDMGGQIFSATLAEDTFTTFRTQMSGRKAIFDPHAIVYAEEPDSLNGLWKQRVRWARGNVQITSVFRHLWAHSAAHPHLGSWGMAFLWFTIFLMPLIQILSATALVSLYFINDGLAWKCFELLWLTAAFTYLVVTFISWVVDWESCAKSWGCSLLFPGLVSLSVIIYSLFPWLFEPLKNWIGWSNHPSAQAALTLFLYSWLALSMAVAYAAKVVEIKGHPRIAAVLLYLAGYGSFLCAVTFGAYVKEWQGSAMTWDKTEKTGKVS